jgi:hypothetical protein
MKYVEIKQRGCSVVLFLHEEKRKRQNRRHQVIRKGCLPDQSFGKEEVRWKFDAVNRIEVVELPTGSKRVGQSSLTLQSEWRSHAAKSMRWWAETVVVLAGRRCPQQQAT